MALFTAIFGSPLLALIANIGIIGGAVGSVASGITGTIIGGVQGVQQAEYQAEMAEFNALQQQRQANYQAELQRNDAFISEQKANQAQQVALQNEQSERGNLRRLLASQEVAAAGAGLAMEGSPLEVMGLTAMEGEKRALSIRRQGEVDWQEADLNARNAKTNALMLEQQGKDAVTVGQMQSQWAKQQGTMAGVQAGIGITGAIGSGIGSAVSLATSSNKTPQPNMPNTGINKWSVGNNFSNEVSSIMTNPYTSMLPKSNFNFSE